MSTGNEEQMRAWVDEASYEELLMRWRFAPSTDTIFHGDLGRHFVQTMASKKNALAISDQVTISKRVGWGRGEQ